LTIRQMFDPEEHDYVVQEGTNFEIIIRPDSELQAKIDSVFWWKE